MPTDNFSNSPSAGNASRLAIADELTILRRSTLIATCLYALACAVVYTALACLLVWQFALWMKSLPAGAQPGWARMVAERPALVAISGSGFVLGALLAVAGMLMWRRVLCRRCPAKHSSTVMLAN